MDKINENSSNNCVLLCVLMDIRNKKTTIIMSGKDSNKISIWLLIGVIVLIVLLLVWLTVADIFGDTDVAAFVTPLSGAFNMLL